jgi:hypothetical protein
VQHSRSGVVNLAIYQNQNAAFSLLSSTTTPADSLEKKFNRTTELKYTYQNFNSFFPPASLCV